MQSQELSYISGRNIKALSNFDYKDYEDLTNMGIMIPAKQMFDVMDALQPLVTTPTITTPVQFLQNWLPGFVHVITAARKIDELVGISTMGQWEDEEVIQGVLELTGSAVPYGDYTNIPLSSWNINFNRYTVVRFEEGMQVSNLEEARAARVQVNSAASKREAAALTLEVTRNAIGFYGFNNGTNRTYGFFNTPGMSGYVTAAVGAAGSTMWANKTFLEITADIRSMVVAIRNTSKDQVDPDTVQITLALATAVVDYLTTTTDFGINVRSWLRDTYPNIRVVSAPELTGANGGANVGYMYADRISDMSTDDGRTFMQVVPTKFMVEGVEKIIKGYREGYTNATAGVFCKRPYALTRITGI